MTTALRLAPYAPADRDALHGLLRDPSLVRQFRRNLEHGELDDPLAHPVLHPGGLMLARDGGRLVGFGMLLVLPSARGRWALLRLGVRAAERRRGIGTALLRAADGLLARDPGPAPAPFTVSVWLPEPDADAFLRQHGFAPFRSWWELDRPLGPVGDADWPEGLEPRTFDGSDAAFREWTDCYNDAFSTRFPSHIATEEEGRHLAAAPAFRADGLLLAWRGGRCAGFVRNTLAGDQGVVDVLGVRTGEQGRGLGRALLRWGVRWLQAQDVPHVRLIVDGANTDALSLYRSEGFVVADERCQWARAADAAGQPRATGAAPPSASP